MVRARRSETGCRAPTSCGSRTLYFSGIERNDGKGDYPLAADCARLENGLVLAGDPALVSPRAKGRPSGQQVGCLEQFNSGIFFYVTRIRDRRFVLVDSERGLVFAFAFFDNAGGDSRFGTLPDGRRVESGPKIPVDLGYRRGSSRSSAGSSGPSNPCCIKSRTAWAPAGARGKNRCRASRAADPRRAGLQLEAHAQP